MKRFAFLIARGFAKSRRIRCSRRGDVFITNVHDESGAARFFNVAASGRLRIETPGGGGHGER